MYKIRINNLVKNIVVKANIKYTSRVKWSDVFIFAKIYVYHRNRLTQSYSSAIY